MEQTKERIVGTRLCGVLLLVLYPFMTCGANFYVSPHGNDDNPGTQSRPFSTLQRAQEAVRVKVAAGLMQDVDVVIREGVYSLTRPLVFGPEDCGSGRFKITYKAFPGERPVISGGRAITGWRKTPDGAWYTMLPEVKEGKWAFRQLFVNGRRATRARHPNKGYMRVEEVGSDRRTHFQFKAGDIPVIQNLSGIELVFLHDWSITRVPVKNIDQESRTVTVQHQIGGDARWAVMDWFEKQPRYYLEDSSVFLDAPGEWFLDRKTGVFTYMPMPDEELSELQIVAPIAEQLLVVRGTENHPVRNLHFEGLAFAHTAWWPDDGVYWGRQACTYWSPATAQRNRPHDPASPATVHFELAESCSLGGCSITHSGPSAVWIGSRCHSCTVSGCRISDVGGNGLMIGEGQWRQIDAKPWWDAAREQAAKNNMADNNLVEHCGQELFGAVGIWVGLAAGTTVSHNEIRALPYTGVSVGWMWWDPKSRPEPRTTPCRENIVSDNHIHHVMQVLSDGGGIYTLGLQPDSFLRGNVIHDVPVNAGRAESNGMFLDQGTGGFVIEENVIYNVTGSPLRFHKGWKNLVRKNVLAVPEGIPTVRYSGTKEDRIELKDNTIVKIKASGPNPVEKVARTALERAGLQVSYQEILTR